MEGWRPLWEGGEVIIGGIMGSGVRSLLGGGLRGGGVGVVMG